MSKELTRKAIAASLVKLLGTYPLDKITVKDIVIDCGINRNTFYYHYKDIYDLLEDIFEAETRKFASSTEHYGNLASGISAAAEFALNNRKAVYHVYRSADRGQLELYLNRVMQKLMSDYIKTLAEGKNVSESDIFCISAFYRHAIIGLFFEWLDRDMKDDPMESIRRIGELFDGSAMRALESAARKN